MMMNRTNVMKLIYSNRPLDSSSHWCLAFVIHDLALEDCVGVFIARWDFPYQLRKIHTYVLQHCLHDQFNRSTLIGVHNGGRTFPDDACLRNGLAMFSNHIAKRSERVHYTHLIPMNDTRWDRPHKLSKCVYAKKRTHVSDLTIKKRKPEN